MEETGFAALIGVDWGDRVHPVVVWDVELGKKSEYSIEQTPTALHGWIDGLMKRFGGRPLAIAVEQSRGALGRAQQRRSRILSTM